MESIGSNSPPHYTPSIGSNSPPRYTPAAHVADRIVRALRHHLRLLHRLGPNFYILGATGNVYTVTLSASPSCSCPDRTIPCKHILFVYLKVLDVPFGDPCLLRRTLRRCQLERLLGQPTAAGVLAGPRAREQFHQLFWSPSEGPATEEGGTCPVCLEMMEGGVVTCGTCRNSLHEECLAEWKRIRGRRAASCVVCRARWRERREAAGYVNLAAYASDEDEGAVAAAAGGGLCES